VRQQVAQLDLRNTWQIAAGAVLVPLGVALILLAWYGAAHARYVQQQIPYLVSGSFVGLGCMVVGGLLFWAHWLYRIYDQADLHHNEQLQAQREMFDGLAQLLLERDTTGNGVAHRPPERERPLRAQPQQDRQDRQAQAQPQPGSNGPVQSHDLVATPSGTFYHLPTCPVAQQRRGRLRPVAVDEAAEMRPCRICDPPRFAE
jgi:hypothetical protein